MAQGRRVQKVSALIRREISQLLINGIRDERVHQAMVTITDVEVSGDLQHCKVFVSIYAEETSKEIVLAGLRAATPFIKGELAKTIKLRRSPEIVFYLDRALEKGTSVMNLLHRLERERQSTSSDCLEKEKET